MHPAYQSNSVSMYLGDCIDVMPHIETGSIDMVLCDLPYGVTDCSWDSIIPLTPLWLEYSRLCMGAIVLTAMQPFTSALVMSNLRQFRYAFAWDKRIATGALNAKRMPMRAHEDVLIFSAGATTYNPQFVERTPDEVKRLTRASWTKPPSRADGCYASKGGHTLAGRDARLLKPPTTVIRIGGLNGCHPERKGVGHPTQKPIALLEYLILTYTNEGDTVLDNTMGSGSTGVACINTGRRFVGIESSPEYFAIAERRIQGALAPPDMGPLFAGRVA